MNRSPNMNMKEMDMQNMKTIPEKNND